MKSLVKENKWLLSLFAFVFCICACFTITSSVTKVSANGTRGNLDYSLAGVSQAAALYINTISSPGYHGAKNVPTSINAGNAGGLIGFTDSDATDRNYWLFSRKANTCVWSYGKLHMIATNQNGSSISSFIGAQGPLGYALYGFALSELGLDEVSTEASNDSMRMMIGIGMMALYVLAVGMSTFFNLIISILQFVNPFRMFSSASALNGWISGFGGSDPYGLGGAVNTFVQQVGRIYDNAHNISLAVLLPLFLAIAVFMWLIVNKGTKFTEVFRPFIIRVIFVTIGVPLMFGIYGVILDSIQGHMSASNSPATTVIGSLFCDFDAWVTSENNLDPPDGYTIKVDVKTMEVSSENMSNVRNICYKINKSNYPSIFTETLADGANGLDSYQKFDTTITSDMNKPTYVIGSTSVPTINQDAEAIGVVLSILQKFARGDKLSASAYESNIIKSMVSQSGRLEEAIIMFGTSSTWQDYDSDECGAFEYKGNDGGGTGTNAKNVGLNINLSNSDVASKASSRWSGGYGSVDIFSNGHLRCTGLVASGGTRFTSASRATYGSANYSHVGQPALSSLALYNYLNTKFTSTEIIVASPTATSNDHILYQHYAVSMVGNSFMRFIYLADAVILLACISIIGYGYGFAMLLGNFKALFQMIPHVLTGMIGSIRGIASAFALMFAMICEVVGTILMFDIAIEIIFACYRIVEIPLAKALQVGGLSNLTSSIGGNVATGLLGVVSCVVILSITKQLLAWRSAIVNATTAACTDFVNKLLKTSVNSPVIDDGGSGLMSKAGTAVLAGASLAMGASRGLYGEDAKNAMDELKSKFTSGEATDGIKAGLLNNDFGVKKGNGTGATTGLSEQDSKMLGTQDSEMSATEAEIAEQEKQRALADSERAGAGVTNTDTSSAAYVAANEADFESALDGNSKMSSLVGDEIETVRGDGYVIDENGLHLDGEESYVDEDGNIVNMSRHSADGTVTTVTKTSNPTDGTTSTSKLVDSADMQYSSVDTYGPDGESHETQTIDKKTGSKVITQDVTTSAGRTLVEQNQHTNANGNVETVTKTVHADGSTTSEVAVVDASTGDRTVNREIQAKGGTTYVNETVHTESNGNVVTTTTKSGSGSGLRGGHQVTATTTNSSGEVIKESVTTYSSANNVIQQDTKEVVQTKNTITETVTSVSGGVTNETVTKVNNAQGTMTKTYKTTGQSGVTTQKVENYVKQGDSYVQQKIENKVNTTNVARDIVNTTHVNTINETVASVQTNTVVNESVKQTNIFDNNAGENANFTSTVSKPSSPSQPPTGRSISSGFFGTRV